MLDCSGIRKWQWHPRCGGGIAVIRVSPLECIPFGLVALIKASQPSREKKDFLDESFHSKFASGLLGKKRQVELDFGFFNSRLHSQRKFPLSISAIMTGKDDFINGRRLVYTREKTCGTTDIQRRGHGMILAGSNKFA